MRDGLIGYMDTPAQGNARPEGVAWAADNGCFGAGYPGDAAWLAWLASQDPDGCLFATAPDVVGDAEATLTRSAPFLPRIRALGYPAALVAQDGLTIDACPWADIDALFIGGTTAWKLGPKPVRSWLWPRCAASTSIWDGSTLSADTATPPPSAATRQTAPI